MRRLIFLAFSSFLLACTAEPDPKSGETILSTVLTPDSKEKTLNRQGRSYYDPRYGPRPLYDRLQYARLDYDRLGRSGCGRCYDERYDDDRDRDRDFDRSRDRYDDDRRVSHRPTYGNRLDRNRDDREDDDRRYSTDRTTNKNGTEEESGDDKKRPHDDNDDRDRGGNRNRQRNRNRDRDRYDDRDRYRPDYYDRFLARDPYRDRPYDRERPFYDDPYGRRPLYERYDEAYAGFGGRHDGYGYPGYRRPAYDDRGNGYDDVYGGYGPGVGRGPHDSFRPWDETYRGQAGWDAGGRGYYFASGRPEPAPAPAPAPAAAPAPASAWQRPQYARPTAESGWQNAAGGSYAGGYRDYRDPLEYRGSLGYGQSGYRQDVSAGYGNGYSLGGPQSQAPVSYGQGFGQAGYVPATGYPQSGWHSVGERVRPYRDQSGVNQIDNRDRDYRYPSRDRDRYPQAGNRQPASTYQNTGYGQNTNAYDQNRNAYDQNRNAYGQNSNTYDQNRNAYGQNSNAYDQNRNAYGQNSNTYDQNRNAYGPTQSTTSSTTPQTSYLYQRDEEHVTKIEETTKSS